MVKRVFNLMYKEIRGLHEAAYILAFFTFLSQLLALIRDRIFAHQFGASMTLDLYYTAFRIPDLLFVIFASILSVYVLIPFVAEARKKGGSVAVRALLSQVFSIFLFCYALVAVLIAMFAYPITGLFFPGFMGPDQDMLVLLVRILLLQPLLLSISNLLGVATQLSQRFILYALSPILYNVGIIFGVVFLYPLFGLSGLVSGVLIGALMHVSIQIPFMRREEIFPKLLFSFDTALLARIFENSIPRALTLALHQIVLLALLGVASIMAVGSVSVFQFAFNLQSVPLAIIGVSYSVAAFPTLARMFTNGETESFIAHVAAALRHIFFWSIPAAALIIVLRAQIVRVILGSGAFGWDDTRLTAAALAIFSISLAAQAVNLLIVRAFYAGGNTRTPLVVTLFSSIAALAFSLLLYITFVTTPAMREFIETLLRVRTVPGTEVLMLPLGYALALVAHTIVLLMFFMKRFQLQFWMFGMSFVQSLVAGVVAGTVAYLALNAFALGSETDTAMRIFTQGFSAGILGILSGGGAFFLMRSPEFTEACNAVHRRINKATLVAPQQSDDMSV